MVSVIRTVKVNISVNANLIPEDQNVNLVKTSYFRIEIEIEH
jgi:hypothetical protein